MKRKIIITDFETTSKIPETTSPWQLAAIVMDPMTLEFLPGSEFNVTMQPDEDRIDMETVAWHANLRNISPETMLATWRNGIPQKQAWLDYANYVKKYCGNPQKPTMFNGPLLGGFNILGFDCIIIEELSRRYGTVDKEGKCNLFFRRDTVDVMKLLWFWFENVPEIEKYSLDYLREYLGMPKGNGHDALQDVKDTGMILRRFLRLHRSIKVKFKDSFKLNP